jgi:hypothetical protein
MLLQTSMMRMLLQASLIIMPLQASLIIMPLQISMIKIDLVFSVDVVICVLLEVERLLEWSSRSKGLSSAFFIKPTVIN